MVYVAWGKKIDINDHSNRVFHTILRLFLSLSLSSEYKSAVAEPPRRSFVGSTSSIQYRLTSDRLADLSPIAHLPYEMMSRLTAS